MTKTDSVLDHVRIASPCSASWVSMKGDDKARFCESCSKNVYNLSAMTRPEAEALILEKEGRLCATYYQRSDGTVLTSDCPVGLRRARWMLARMAGVAASIVGACFATAMALGLPGPIVVRMRDAEPFSRICRWLSPPMPVAPPSPKRTMGSLAFTLPPKNTINTKKFMEQSQKNRSLPIFQVNKEKNRIELKYESVRRQIEGKP